MLELEAMPEMVEQRQAYLRSLAHHRHDGVPQESIRQQVGRTLVLLGQWVEGRREDRAEMFPALAGPRADLAGRAR